jgi:Fur family transcriptional regulator, ferric uptake regulator
MAVDDARLEELLGRLRDGGGRITEPRRAVLEVLLDTIDEHLSVEELAELVHRRRPDVHRSTVYRTLEAFEVANLVQHVHLGHSPSTYHLADQPHHHAVCDTCGTVIHLPDETFEPVAERLRRDFGFVPSPHHFAIPGRCATCLESNRDPGSG